MSTKKSKYVSDKYKQGRISNDEIDFIKKNMGIMSEQQIADALKRRVEKIQEIKGQILTNQQGLVEDDVSLEIVKDIRKSPEWPWLKKQFSSDELSFFVYRYSQLCAQFGKDSTPTEQMQLISAIQLEIFMQRSAIATRQAQLEKDENEQLLQKVIQKAIETEDPEERAKLYALKQDIQSKITGIVSGLRENTNQYNNLHKRLDDQMKSLKATRDQRLDKIEKSGKTFIGLLKMLDERENAERESRYHELVKLAVKKEKKRLSEFHTFVDGGVDRPLLTPETVEDSEEENV